jgi:alanine racemase
MAVASYRSWVEISLGRIAENYRVVREAVGPGVQTVCVVKADAYGHGALEVSRALAAQGAGWLAVSSAEEGVALRQAGIGARILVMADGQPFARPALLEYGLTPVLLSLEDLREMESFAAERGARLAYHLKIDSGMGRLGTLAAAEEIAAAIRAAGHLEIEGLMSHLASSADYTKAQTEDQTRTFDDLCRALCREGIVPPFRHLASTNAIAYGRREAWHNMVRPGHLLYGYFSPARGQAPSRVLSVQPALTWKASVLAVKDVPQGALIGYGGMFRAAKPMRIGVLAVGYADGLSHRLSNRGHVIAAGRLVPILGAVSMDLTTIDLTDCPSIGAGDAVTLLGSEGEASINAQQMARMAGTISYDILCGIRTRVKRLYTEAD